MGGTGVETGSRAAIEVGAGALTVAAVGTTATATAEAGAVAAAAIAEAASASACLALASACFAADSAASFLFRCNQHHKSDVSGPKSGERKGGIRRAAADEEDGNGRREE